MTESDLARKLNKLNRRGWTLKPYKLWGPDKPCPPRLVVNTYKGCDFNHSYCYISNCAQQQEGFREHLEERINQAKQLDLTGLLVIVSSSTDPFQSIEREHKDSHFAIKTLLKEGFPVLVMTRNPQMLLEKEYLDMARNLNLFIDVSIPSLHENDTNSIFYSSAAPSLNKTFEAIQKLSEIGKYIRIKIEPIIPSVGNVLGQNKEELKELVKLSKNAGAQMVITKTMRLNEAVPSRVYYPLFEYYSKKGIPEKYGKVTNHVLRSEVRRQLLNPVYEACEEEGIPFCACVDSDVFLEKSSKCSFEIE